MEKRPYTRLLLKLSGESLMKPAPAGQAAFGIDFEACQQVARAILALINNGFHIGIVIGGGNFFRGITITENGMARTPADHIGMLATIMNGIALQQALIACGGLATVMSAIECPKIVDSYRYDRACELLADKHCVIFVGGTGNPYFSTDTAAALRASEMGMDVLLKATKVDGIYDKDPLRFLDAKRYSEISYSQILAEKLQVMDATAIALCQRNAIPIIVFNMRMLFNKEQMISLLSHKAATQLGTLVHG